MNMIDFVADTYDLITKFFIKSSEVYDVILNAKVKSTKNGIKIQYNGETVKLSKKKIKKAIQNDFRQNYKKYFRKTICCIMIFSAIQFVKEPVKNYIEHQQNIVDVRTESRKEAEEFLKNGNFQYDYSDIHSITKEDLYGLLLYCGKTETDKILRECGYHGGWNEYLSQRGFYDEDGKPSVREWEKYMENILSLEKGAEMKNGR